MCLKVSFFHMIFFENTQSISHNLPVTNFSQSFRDGKVLSGLVDCLVPGELNMKRVRAAVALHFALNRLRIKVMSGTDARRTLERAMDIAETKYTQTAVGPAGVGGWLFICHFFSLDIPRILEPSDFLDGKPDDLSVMTYVSFFRMKWNRPRLSQAEADEKRTLLEHKPERAAPSGTIRRLMVTNRGIVRVV